MTVPTLSRRLIGKETPATGTAPEEQPENLELLAKRIQNLQEMFRKLPMSRGGKETYEPSSELSQK